MTPRDRTAAADHEYCKSVGHAVLLRQRLVGWREHGQTLTFKREVLKDETAGGFASRTEGQDDRPAAKIGERVLPAVRVDQREVWGRCPDLKWRHGHRKECKAYASRSILSPQHNVCRKLTAGATAMASTVADRI